MYIAQDHPLPPKEQRLFELFQQTYPTEQSRFAEYRRLSRHSQLNEEILHRVLHESNVFSQALRRIQKQAGKTRLGHTHEVAWCVQVASEALSILTPKETK